jgi:hypothetical protein
MPEILGVLLVKYARLSRRGKRGGGDHGFGP